MWNVVHVHRLANAGDDEPLGKDGPPRKPALLRKTVVMDNLSALAAMRNLRRMDISPPLPASAAKSGVAICSSRHLAPSASVACTGTPVKLRGVMVFDRGRGNDLHSKD